MFPFVPPADLTDTVVAELESLVGQTPAFSYALTGVRRFEPGVVYLEPAPADPFVRLTRDIGERFGMLPFGGAFGKHPIPHLTIAMPESGRTLQEIAKRLEPDLPISLIAEEAWLMAGSHGAGWKTIRVMPFTRTS
jgi:2'-5' RNA ligase